MTDERQYHADYEARWRAMAEARHTSRRARRARRRQRIFATTVFVICCIAGLYLLAHVAVALFR